MKKIVEKVVLAFCYMVTITASIRMYVSLIMGTEKLTTGVVINLIVVGVGLLFLSVMAFILLFTKRPND
jgi:hypothetical protein